MNTSPKRTNGSRPGRRWLRRGHRWVGLSLIIFILFLSITGIALNHSGGLELDRRYVGLSWVLDAYGLHVPSPSASFADAGHRATLLGERLFLDGRDIGRRETALAGITVLGSMVVIGGEQTVYLLTADGEFVEAIDLAPELNGSIERVGRSGNYALLQSSGKQYRSDADITMFDVLNEDSAAYWSVETPPDAAEMTLLETAWRGRGVTIERLLLDLHSGRFVGKSGPLFMDFVAVLLIVLSLSGLILSTARNRRKRERPGSDRDVL
jgi:hypothetical protein